MAWHPWIGYSDISLYNLVFPIPNQLLLASFWSHRSWKWFATRPVDRYTANNDDIITILFACSHQCPVGTHQQVKGSCAALLPTPGGWSSWMVLNLYCCEWLMAFSNVYSCEWLMVYMDVYWCEWLTVYMNVYCREWLMVYMNVYWCEWLVYMNVYWCEWLMVYLNVYWCKWLKMYKNVYCCEWLIVYYINVYWCEWLVV